MASSANHFSLFLLLLTLLLHTHARDSQFFNKLPSTTNNVVVPNNNNKPAPVEQQQQEDPSFLPESENGYGLYGHETGQNPPSTTTAAATTTAPEFKQPAHKYLPKNYNPVSYVTQPEDFNDQSTTFTEQRTFATNPTNYNNGQKDYYSNQQQESKNYYNNQQEQETTNYYNNQQEQESAFRRYPASTNNRNNDNYYYNGGSSFNTQPQGISQSDARYSGGAAAFTNSYQPQGMSDTRFLENGKYFYDINADKYSNNHPYESLKARNEYTNRNFERNGYEFNGENAMGGYENQEEFQDEP